MKHLKAAVFIFLLALSFTGFASVNNAEQFLTVTVTNSSANNKTSETVEIPWKNLTKLNNLKPNEILVKQQNSGLEIPSQVIYNGKKEPQSIIFQTDITAKSTQNFTIVKGVPAKYTVKIYGRQMPQRFDDFAWENDKAAFRMYGEALEGKGGMAKGIDFGQKEQQTWLLTNGINLAITIKITVMVWMLTT